MKYHKNILACEKGFYIDSQLVKPLGINENSHCWGIIVEGKDDNQDINDLIVSPLPHRSWPCIIRMQIRIKRDNATASTNKIFEAFNTNGFNIIAMQFTHAGYKHEFLDVILESIKAREQADEIKSKNEKSADKIKAHYNHLFSQANLLSENIHSNTKIHLYTEEEPDINPPKAEQNDEKDIRHGAFYDNRFSGLKWQWLYSLATHAFEDSKNKYRFLYTRSHGNGLLVFDPEGKTEKNYPDFLQTFNPQYNNTPFLASANFNPEFNYFRLRPLILENMRSIRVDYTCNIINPSTNGNVITHGSLGFFSETLKVITSSTKETFDLVQASVEGLQRKSPYSEKGALVITGRSPTFARPDFNANSMLEEIKNQLKRMPEIKFKVKAETVPAPHTQDNNSGIICTVSPHVSISTPTPWKIFVSFKQEFMDADNARSIITAKLRQYGLEPVFSQTLTRGITDNVIADMGRCNACLQIYTLSREEKRRIIQGKGSNLVPDYAWLLFECGLAMQRGIPIGRMIDTTHFPKENWVNKLKVAQDRFLVEFTGDVCTELTRVDSFVNQLEILSAALISELDNNVV